MTSPTPREAALALVRRGFAVFPVHTPTPGGPTTCSCRRPDCPPERAGKHPRTRRGLKDATHDPAQVEAWWARAPDGNVAIATGTPSGVFAVDLDAGTPGLAWFVELCTAHGGLERTCAANTGGGGTHLLYRFDERLRAWLAAHDRELPSRNGEGERVSASGVPPKGFDVKAEGGYILVAPSLHRSGRRYMWFDDHPIEDAPEWVLELVSTPRPRPSPAPAPPAPAVGDSRERRYGLAVLANACRRVTEAPEGSRHRTLRAQARTVGGLAVANGFISESEAEEALVAAGMSTGKDAGEARRTVLWGLRNGQQARLEKPPSQAELGALRQPRAWTTQDPGEPPPDWSEVPPPGDADLPGPAQVVPPKPVEPEPPKQETPPEMDERPPRESEVARPEILVNGRDTIEVLEDAWDAVRAYNHPLPTVFRRAGRIARIRATETGPVIYDCGPNDVQALLINAARWRRTFTTRAGEERVVPVEPPRSLAPAMVALPEPALPLLEGVIRVPVFDADARLLSERGYDDHSHLYYAPMRGFVTPTVPARPTERDVVAARELLLNEWLGDFPFVKESDRAHALAILLNPFVRRLYDGPSPLHLVEATSMGTGKSLLAAVLLVPSQGRPAETLTYAEDEGDMRKLITTTLAEGAQVVFFDNVDTKVRSAVLAQALTTDVWKDRILGQSSSVTVPNLATWVLTVNNAVVNTDIARRSIRVRLDRGAERPWEWQGMRIKHLRSWTMERRSALLRAALVLVQAWIAAGRQLDEDAHLGSFEGWARLMGGILRHAGVPGFLHDLDELYRQADTGLGEWRAFVGTWWLRFGSVPVFPKQLVELATTEGMLGEVLGAGTERAQVTRLGLALHRLRGRIFDGRRVGDQETRNGRQYRLELHETGEPRLAPVLNPEPATYPRRQEEPPVPDDEAQPRFR